MVSLLCINKLYKECVNWLRLAEGIAQSLATVRAEGGECLSVSPAPWGGEKRRDIFKALSHIASLAPFLPHSYMSDCGLLKREIHPVSVLSCHSWAPIVSRFHLFILLFFILH